MTAILSLTWVVACLLVLAPFYDLGSHHAGTPEKAFIFVKLQVSLSAYS